MKWPNFTTNLARVIAGGGVFGLAVLVLFMIYTKPELADNDLFAMLAQAVIIQGLVGLVMAFLFTGRNGQGDGIKAANEKLNEEIEP